jgi:hypothetical protein
VTIVTQLGSRGPRNVRRGSSAEKRRDNA